MAARLAETASIRTLAAPLRLRVVADSEGFPLIPGRFGQIEYHDGVTLAVFTPRRRLHAKLSAIPGLVRWQVGESEFRGLFPPEALDQIAGIIRAKRKPPGRSAEEMRAVRSKSSLFRPQDRTDGAT
jgi:hypothetical protein